MLAVMSLTAAVVGAGPAGSTAARLLAAQGARVTLFEGRRLPRPKLCGGGLTPKAQRLLPPAVLATVERRVDAVELQAPPGVRVRVADPAASVAMVERREFDTALVDAAADVGAAVRDAEAVVGLSTDGREVTLITTAAREHFDLALLADGEPSRLSHRVGLASAPRCRALAVEVDLPFSRDLRRDVAFVSYRMRGGYAWCFPKGDHANVGLATRRAQPFETLRDALFRFARSLGLDPGEGRIRGHWIPAGLRRGPLARDRILLLGDAAATADPFFGEGISYALASAVVAADAVAAWADGTIPDLCPYDTALRAALGPVLDRLYAVARAVELCPTAAVLGVRFCSLMRQAAADVVTGRGVFAIDARLREAQRVIRSSPQGPSRGTAIRTERERACPATD
ncbi:MAG TPA: geranylgeranyl reductase family protein [Gaiellaceae bacterium]|nr:geranylgeranyl reductase family protein [Gaiellaceae bacterium]